MPKKRVLIVCTGNSARSQMAEGLLRHEAGNRFEIFSAGTEPGQLRLEAVQAMSELGIDISEHFSKPVSLFADREFDYVITVCDKAKEKCPVFSGNAERMHWPFDDPAAAPVEDEARLKAFRRIRDRIHARVMVFLGEGAYDPSPE